MSGSDLMHGTSRRYAFLTGAGLSTAAGIPDFRGPEGVWTKDPEAERTSTLSWYLSDEDVRKKAWRMRAAAAVWEKRPTAAHRAIAGFSRRHEVTGLVTQNVDGLHQAAGSDPSLVLEVHGNARRVKCEDCARVLPMEAVVARVAAGEPDPACRDCGGVLRATTILFEEMLDADVIDAAIAAAESCDVLIAAGTGLGVQPVAGLFPLAAENGAHTVIVNAEPTPFDRIAGEVRRGDLQEALPLLLAELEGAEGSEGAAQNSS